MAKMEIQACSECGASVYPEHIESGKAAVFEDKLRCPYCWAEYKKLHHVEEERAIGQTTMRAPGEGERFKPISVDLSAASGDSQVDLRAVGGGGESFAGVEALLDDSHLKRPLISQGVGSTRCRTFHAKLNDGAVAFMNKHIIEWADANPDVVIKFATSTIGVWEGKKADPHLIVTVFY